MPAGTSPPLEGPLGPCDSCGRDATDLEAVHRVYVTPESWDAEEKAEVQPDVESWCFSCRTHYPHQEVAG
ncbi:MAG: hypothetical protein QOD30_980 [Actinomycetota bacterium]|nr:hypothetical protein [Actinomycetota bacterium]